MRYYIVWMKILIKKMEQKNFLEIELVISSLTYFIDVDYMCQNLNFRNKFEIQSLGTA